MARLRCPHDAARKEGRRLGRRGRGHRNKRPYDDAAASAAASARAARCASIFAICFLDMYLTCREGGGRGIKA